MEEPKRKIAPKYLPIIEADKNKLSKETITFMDVTTSNNYLLLLSSNNTIFLCQLDENSLKIEKGFKNIIINSKSNIKSCYFCNGSRDSILLLCDDYNIYEFSVNREYISHIFYNVLGDSYIFKMNCKKNSKPENGIKNFSILKEREINVWNTLEYNKSNVLCVSDIECFSYDCTGFAMYILGKYYQKNCYYLSVIKFINEYEWKEIYFKVLNFIELKIIDITYFDIFDNNIIMCDKEYQKIYILKNYPMNKFDFIFPLSNTNRVPLLFLPFIGEDKLFQFGILYINFNEKKKNILNVCYKYNKCNTIEVDIKINKAYYYKENTNEKSLLFVFDDIKKELIKYLM